MQVLLNTDTHTHGDLLGRVEADIVSTLGRFSRELTRVEVHLSDHHGSRGGVVDVHCLVEVRPARLQPITVSHVAATLEEACSGAVRNVESVLDATLGRTASRHARESIRHPGSVR